MYWLGECCFVIVLPLLVCFALFDWYDWLLVVLLAVCVGLVVCLRPRFCVMLTVLFGGYLSFCSFASLILVVCVVLVTYLLFVLRVFG